MNSVVRDLASALGDVLERAYELGRAVGAGEAEASRTALAALRAEAIVEALGLAVKTSKEAEGAAVDSSFVAGGRSAMVMMLETAARKPGVLAETLQLDPLEGLVDGGAVVETAREALERRGRLSCR